ncbi:FimD/PapC N-terminal domain-containing protein, partial [Klebsiella pneumoniae]
MRHGPAHTVTVVSLSILLGGQSALLHAQATFNMDLLEKNDHLPAVDLQRFNQQAGQPPGAYPVSWQVNGVTLDARKTVTLIWICWRKTTICRQWICNASISRRA